MWDLIVSIPDHCLSFYFTLYKTGIAQFCQFLNLFLDVSFYGLFHLRF